jgi:hypothetical protein
MKHNLRLGLVLGRSAVLEISVIKLECAGTFLQPHYGNWVSAMFTFHLNNTKK